MNAKKILTLIVAVAMMLSVFVLPANAEVSATNLVLALPTTVAVDAGEGFDLELKLTGFMAMAEFQVIYNADYFTFGEFTALNDSGITVKSAESGKVVLKSMAFTDLGGATGWDKALGTLSFTAKDASALGDNASVTETISVSDIYSEGLGYSIGNAAGKTYNTTEGYTATFTNASVTVSKPPVAPKLSGTLVLSETAKINTAITASGVTGTDDNGDDVTIDYKWYRVAEDTTETLIDGATGASYTPVAADYDCKIKVVATATTTVEPTTGDSQEAVTTAKVDADETAAASVTGVGFEGDVIVNKPAKIVYNFTASDNGGVDDSTVTVTAKDGSTMYGTFDSEAKTYTATIDDYNNGTIIVVNVTAKGDRDTATTAATPFEFDCSNALAGNLQPEIGEDFAVYKAVEEGVEALGEAAPVVGDVLSVDYTWTDISAVGGPDQSTTDVSVVTWTIGEKVVEAKTYTVAAEDIGEEIEVTVVAKSSDPTPNEYVEGDVTVGNTRTATTAAAAKNPAYVPTVDAVAFSKDTVRVSTAAAIEYTFEDLNGFEDASVVTIEKAAIAEEPIWTAAVAGTDYTTDLADNALALGAKVKFTKEVKGMLVRIVVDPKNSDGYDVAEDEVASTPVEVKAKASTGGGLTGPTLGGATTPSTPDTPDTPDTPVVVPADAVVLTIGDNTVHVFGEETENDVAPVLVNDRTMLPARVVAEALGAEVAWDEAARTVTITKGDVVIVITIDSDKALVGEEEVTLDSAAYIANDRTYTPMRFIAEALGATVEWNAEAQQVVITPAK